MKSINFGIIVILFLSVIFSCSLFGQQVPEPSILDSVNIGWVRIVKSGFMRKDSLDIKYRRSDRRIVAVHDNGKEISENRFYKYESRLNDALDGSRTVEVLPELETMEKRLKSLDVPDSVKIVELDKVLKDLEDLKSSLAKTYKNEFKVKRNLISLEMLREDMQNELEKCGYDIKEKIKEIEINLKECRINKVILNYELSYKLRQIYEEFNNRKIEKGEKIRIIFED